MSRLPIRARLTAAFALAMVVVLAAAGLFVYLRLEADLREGVDTSLEARADALAALVERSGGRLTEPVGSAAEPEESFAQLLTPEARLLDGIGGAGDPALSPDETARAAAAPVLLDRELPGIDGTARVLARPATVDGRSLVIVAGASLEDVDETLGGLVASFAIGGPVAVLAASGLGYLLATAGLRPVEAIRRRAERISLRREGERLPLPAARDEVRRLGETLNDMLARLEASFARERRLVADAGHELRTPLAVQKAELEAALRIGGCDPELRESLAAALEETDHLAQLADDLLLIASARDGRLPVQLETVELRRLLEQARERFVDRAREQRREISVAVPDGLRAPLDPLRLRQALGNLVDNALRHGAGEVGLAARPDREGVRIEVSDQGPGFSPEIAGRAFERFARGDKGRSRGGAGLGLAIVSAIAEAHGGTAAIAETDSGATVRLRFPATPKSQDDESS